MTDSRKGMIDVIENMVAEELEVANKSFPLFASWHESYAVIKEEVEEAAENMELITEEGMMYLWNSIRMKDVDEDARVANVEGIRKLAVEAIQELVQVAAMCDKSIKSMEKDIPADEVEDKENE
nr:MAG TPA: hypothetical protein [Caudoviricetes sp.]